MLSNDTTLQSLSQKVKDIEERVSVLEEKFSTGFEIPETTKQIIFKINYILFYLINFETKYNRPAVTAPVIT